MARRRKSNDEAGINLDSLMDALTNVVAVLILVLVLVQMDVTQIVVQYFENLEPATPEQVQQSKKELEKVEGKLKKQEDLLTQDPPTPEEIKEEKRQLALLEKDAKVNEELLADLNQLKKLERKLRVERDIEESETTRLQKEIAKLEAQLDATPVLVSVPTEVSIPNSRPVPNNADMYYALVFADRVHFIDPFTPLDLFESEFRKHKKDWELERIKRQGKDRYIYDQKKIVAHFKDFDFKNSRGQTVAVLPNTYGTRLSLEIKPDKKEGGTSLDELKGTNTQFQRTMSTLARNRQAVIMFYVHPASFNSYLLARPVADKNRVPAGWEVRGGESYRVMIPDLEVRRLKEPPPADPNKKPKKQPPGIKPSLD